MLEKPAGADRFNWWLPLYAVLGAFVLFVPVAYSQPDISLFTYVCAVLAISLVFITLLLREVIAKRARRCLSILSMLAIGWTASAVLVANNVAIRAAARWLMWSHDYKAEVLAIPTPPDGELKHIEWDGWGWAGQDTTVYLVFDPTDSLSAATRGRESGKFSDIPCEVNAVHRLESHWYAVQFYTNESWDRCN